MSGKYVRLADPDGSFFDPETKFHVGRGEVAELIPPIGKLTVAKIAGKGLIEGDPPAKKPGHATKSPAGSAEPGDRSEGTGVAIPTGPGHSPDDLRDVAKEIIDRRIEVLKGEAMSILRDMAKELGLKIGAAISKQKLATEIAVAEWQREHGAGK